MRTLRIGILCIVILAIAGCSSRPATPPVGETPVALPLPSEAESTVMVSGGSVTGTAFWGDAPLADARIELLPDDWRVTGDETAVGSATSDADGQYTITNVPTGEWSVVAYWPDGERSEGGTPVVDVVAGHTVADTIVRLERSITLLEPDLSQPGSATPTIRWEPIDGIDTYRVLLIDMGTTEAVVQEMVSGDQLAVAEGMLQPSRSYTLVISGMDAAGEMPLASFTGEYDVAGP